MSDVIKAFAARVIAFIAATVVIIAAITVAYIVIDDHMTHNVNTNPAYAQQIITVGDVKWLCLSDHDKPISCQLISPLTDDKLNNYKHINVL